MVSCRTSPEVLADKHNVQSTSTYRQRSQSHAEIAYVSCPDQCQPRSPLRACWANCHRQAYQMRPSSHAMHGWRPWQLEYLLH